MASHSYPQNQSLWYLPDIPTSPLRQDIKTQVLIVGGGMAGLSAAQAFAHKGFSVTLIEKYFCGAGASGKSSGFITPNSELGLEYFVHHYGPAIAERIWQLGVSGTKLIEHNINHFSITCDYTKQDSLALASSKGAFKELQKDHAYYQKLSFASTLHSQYDIQALIGSTTYYGGLQYPGTFGINSFAYCRAMKEILIKKGVAMFEDTPALSIEGSTVTTPHARIEAEYIVVCLDHFLPELHKLTQAVFQVQTFLLVSAPLSAQQLAALFPRQHFMAWDSQMIYNYFRIVDKNRLLIGGSDLFSIFWGREQYARHGIYKKLTHYLKKTFPALGPIAFEFMWPGLIGISKDLVPIATADKDNPNIFYITAATGLPWAAALGWYSAERVADKNNEFDRYFSINRKFLIGNGLQRLLGKHITFALSNFLATR